jgi:hypothetical protein
MEAANCGYSNNDLIVGRPPVREFHGAGVDLEMVARPVKRFGGSSVGDWTWNTIYHIL